MSKNSRPSDFGGGNSRFLQEFLAKGWVRSTHHVAEEIPGPVMDESEHSQPESLDMVSKIITEIADQGEQDRGDAEDSEKR